jgi:hypothetical protein
MPPVLSWPAAVLDEIFEHPAVYSPIALYAQTILPPPFHNPFLPLASEADLGPDVRLTQLEYSPDRRVPSEPSRVR